MNETCGCCEGVQKLTPRDIANRPGLDALLYRVGTHASFLETMIARLSSLSLDDPLINVFDVEGRQEIETIYPLQQLTTRAVSDPAIAFLDAWATVADVLTFYQERIANEGYLRTATERRSILELARLVGYKLRPGVAASVYLAYTLEKDHNVVILPRNRAQSVPGPGEKAQPFETEEKLEARFAWNTLKPRLTRPQLITPPMLNKPGAVIYLQGTATNVKQGDPLLFLFNPVGPLVRTVSDVVKQQAAKRTKVRLGPPPSGAATHDTILPRSGSGVPSSSFGDIVHRLELPPSLQPPNAQRLARDVTQTFAAQSDIHLQMLTNLVPQLQNTLYSAVVNTPVTPATSVEKATGIQVFRVQAAPFGYNAPPHVDEQGKPLSQDWPLVDVRVISIDISLSPQETGPELNLVALSGGLQFKNGTISVTQSPDDPHSPDHHIWSSSTITIQDGQQSIQLKDANNNNGPPVTINANASEIAFTIQFQELTQVLHITGEETPTSNSAVGVRFEPDEKIVIGPDLEQVISTINHQGLVTFSPDKNLSITDRQSLTTVLSLDAQYDKIVPLSWVSIERPEGNIISQIQSVQTVFLSAYNISARVTQLVLDRAWLKPTDRLLSDIRGIVVHAQSEPRGLAEAPVEEDIAATALPASTTSAVRMVAAVSPPSSTSTINKGTDTIELDQLYDGLKAGQRMIVFGERTDVLDKDGNPIPGILDGELVMLKAVKQDVFRDSKGNPLPGDKPHTSLIFANKLSFTYRRETVVIYANVVRATHGETRNEVLGSGDGSQELQHFTLRQFPLTYVPANTPSGVASTLEVRVNNLLWHEAGSLPELHPTDRGYITETDDASKTTVIFGNGIFGARLPTGVENVTAKYRTGIGKPGNVQAGQITLLSTKPLGVKSVVNPLQASGGADRESRDQARRNVPLAALALDRLVCVEDYEHFARTFGGIGKASAVQISDSHRQLVHLTIVGADNAPILTTSDLYNSLFSALRQFGDPNEPLIVAVAEVLFLVISARVHLLPDFQFESVEQKIRTALLATFSFDSRDLGQSVFQSEVISTIQNVPGVDYVELEVMGAVGQDAITHAIDSAQSDQTAASEDDDKEKEDKAEVEVESAEVEKAEEFLEALKLTQAVDVPVQLARPDKDNPLATNGIAPAQLAFLSPDVPDTLILSELP